MDHIIKSWNVESGNLYSLGATSFDEAKVKSMDWGTRGAIRLLCKKVLESTQVREIATKSYRNKGELICAVAFCKEKGLSVKLNGDELFVAKANEVFLGTFPGLQEIKKIQSAAERQGLVPMTPTEEKTKDVFQRVMAERQSAVESSSLFNRVRIHTEKVWGIADLVSFVRNILGVAAPTIISGYAALAIFGGIIISLGGLSATKAGFDDMVLAILHENREKFFIACANLMAGLTALSIGVLFVMEWIAKLGHHVLTAAAAGAAFPVSVLMFYCSALVASIYKLYVQWKFSSELEKIMGDGTDKKKVKEALIWLKQKTQLSHLEMKEQQEVETGMCAALHKKWEQFTLRTGIEVFEGLLDPKKLDNMINGLESQNPEDWMIVGGKQIVADVLESNQSAMKWTMVSIVANTIGVIAMVAYLALGGGHIGILVSSTLFAIAAFISFFVDSPTFRKDVCQWLLEKIQTDGPESEKSLQHKECSSTTSSITSDQKEGSPPTPSKPTDGTSSLSLAS